MKFYIKDSYEDYLDFASDYILRYLESSTKEKERLVISLPSEEKDKDIYKCIVAKHSNFDIDFSKMYIFQQFEYVGLPLSHLRSRAYLLNDNLLKYIPVPLENIFLLDGSSSETQMTKSEILINKFGLFDFIWMSMSSTGIFAGNEIHSSLSASFRPKTLTRELRNNLLYLFDNKIRFVPTRTFSMGMSLAFSASEILLTSSGIESSFDVQNLIELGINDSNVLSMIQKHRNANFIIDKCASMRLSSSSLSASIHL